MPIYDVVPADMFRFATVNGLYAKIGKCFLIDVLKKPSDVTKMKVILPIL
jgi:hypothetical protein